MPLLDHPGRAAAILAIFVMGLTACAGRRQRRDCVTPGFLGEMKYSIQNESSRVDGVGMTVSAPDGIPLIMRGIKIMETPDVDPPISIESGQTRTFVISFRIGDKRDPIPERDFALEFQPSGLNTQEEKFRKTWLFSLRKRCSAAGRKSASSGFNR